MIESNQMLSDEIYKKARLIEELSPSDISNLSSRKLADMQGEIMEDAYQIAKPLMEEIGKRILQMKKEKELKEAS